MGVFPTDAEIRVRLSAEALRIFDQIGTGSRALLYSPDLCQLSDSRFHKGDSRPLETVDRKHCDELRAVGWISPLSQFGFHHKVGWREWYGDLGEKFDIYLCTQ